MRIGIIGAGHIGSTLARHFVSAGHEVAIANSRGPATLKDLAADLGAEPATVEDAARFGNVVVVSIPFGRYQYVPVDAVVGKTVIDTNNYYPQRDGHYAELDGGIETSSGLLQRHLVGADVVKAFNAIRWDHLRDYGRAGGAGKRHGIPIAGDSSQAKRQVMDLIEQMGFEPVDAGDLAAGRTFEPGTEVYGADLFGEELSEKVGVRVADR
jgi:predicted dinucleotide-binding enzyme